MTQQNNQRTAFETIAFNEGLDLTSISLTSHPPKFGGYVNPYTTLAYKFWQAAIEHDRKGLGEPVAWMHDQPGRVDVIHADVKKLLIDSHEAAGYLNRPLDKSERYTIPLYKARQPAEPVKVPNDETYRLVGVIADKIEDGSLFQAGIFSRREMADKVRSLIKAARYGQPAASAEPCQTCNGNGMIGGPSYYSPDEGGEPCPDCVAPVAAQPTTPPADGQAQQEAKCQPT